MKPERLHIWIVGASGGIGAAVTRALAPSHNLTLSARNETALHNIQRSIGLSSIQVSACDVLNDESVNRTIHDATQKFGPIDVLINSSGIGVWKDLVEMSAEEFSEQIRINLTGAFLCYHAVLPTMISRQRGMIVTVNSIASVTSYPGNSAYAASKAGTLAMTRVLRNEVRQHGVKVTDIILGSTISPMWDADIVARSGDRMMTPDDVCPIVEFLISQMFNPRSHFEEIVLRPQRGDL